MVGLASADDAAVYQISDDQALIFTTDFFTPVVDDPYTYGAVAAANAMSDVYAMGGQVVLALSIAAFPPKLPARVIGEILRGAAEKVAEAGGVIAGGHTIDDDEPKFGLAVMGTVHPSRVGKKGGARPGDQLLLTKPLGVGIITTAAKGDQADPAHVEGAIQSMIQLNRQAAELAQQVEFHAMTDITGFALLGHGYEMASASGVRLRIKLVITDDERPRIQLQERMVYSYEELLKYLNRLPRDILLVIEPEPKVPYKHVIGVFNTCLKSKKTNIVFAVTGG